MSSSHLSQTMVQFNFRLQSVLDYRRSLADRLRVTLADRERQLRGAEQRLAQLFAARDQAIQSLSARQNRPFDVSAASQTFVHIQRLDADIADQRLVVERAGMEYKQARQDVLQQEMSAKSLEKLRERQHERWAADESRREQVESSEIAAVFHRRMNGC